MMKSMMEEMQAMMKEMPDELKELLGISPTDFNRGEKEDKFDWDNPPTSNKDIPDSVIPAECFTQLVIARKAIISAKDSLINKGTAETMSKSSPYAQMQFMVFMEEMETAIRSINTALHINDSDFKKSIDEVAEEAGEPVKDFVESFLMRKAVSAMVDNLFK